MADLTQLNDALSAYRKDERAIQAELLPWVPFQEGSRAKFLRFDLAHGGWVELFQVAPGATYSRHRHIGGQVVGFVLEGSWRYLERTWTATPGTLVYEPPGDVHTLAAGPEGMTTLFYLTGSVQYLDEHDNELAQDDVETLAALYLRFCEEQGREPDPIFF
jgi:quercetin dioxygenase-like cupin family protein